MSLIIVVYIVQLCVQVLLSWSAELLVQDICLCMSMIIGVYIVQLCVQVLLSWSGELQVCL
jgi:hypothetical protein